MGTGSATLSGRQHELAALSRALEATAACKGGLLLIAGEAGVGKTRLVEVALSQSNLTVLTGRATAQASAPYGPLVAALRDYLRQVPDGLEHCGSLARFLPMLLPELGDAPKDADRAAVIEALRNAFACIAHRQPAVCFIEDLQWADHATFECLPQMAGALAGLPLLLIATYRKDEIPRGHPLRALRIELRRQRQLREMAVEPLDRQASAEFAAHLLGSPLSPSLSADLYQRTQGIPLFIEEIAGALSNGRHLRNGKAGLERAAGHDVPLPDSLRDAVLLRLDALSPPARRWLEMAAVMGAQFDLDVACACASDDAALDELFEHNWLVELQAGSAAFRHALTHEAIYNQIPWTRRRSWHRDIAQQLTARGAPAEAIVEHWLAAREHDLARRALLECAEKSCRIHAYNDAAQAMHRALELWPRGVDEAKRLDVLDRLGHCAQLSGRLSDAIQAWREAAEHLQHDEDRPAFAQTQRKLATVYELQGAWEQALTSRQTAASVFTAIGLPAEAALERLLAAAHLRSASRFRAALELLTVARSDVAPGDRWDVQARILGLEGNVRARMGDVDAGLAMVRAGLALALEHNLRAPAAEVYQRLADALEHAGDYAGAKDTYQTAFDFCQTHGSAATGQVCMACLTAVLLHTGEWDRAVEICREVIASPDSPQHALAVVCTVQGVIFALRGQASRSRALLAEASAISHRIELAPCELLVAWGWALLDAQGGHAEAAAAHCRALLAQWQQYEDRHYAIAPLLWAVTHFAGQQAGAEARACANALATIAASTGQNEALSALACALGEVAALDGDNESAVAQFEQAIALLQHETSPFEQAETHFRAGVMLLRAGKRAPAIDHFVQAFRIAEKLGAKPLAAQVARELAALGEKIDQRLGRRAANKVEHAGLTRRQLEILRLVALGQTNPEIARALTLSPRTVEMHVADIFTRLDCHTRTEAVHKATALDLLKTP